MVTFIRVCVFVAEATEIHSAAVDVDQHPLEVTSMGRLAQRKIFHKRTTDGEMARSDQVSLMRFGTVDESDLFSFSVQLGVATPC